MRLRVIILGILVLLLAGLAVIISRDTASAPTLHTSKQTAQSSQPGKQSAFNKHQFSTSDPTSIWVIVNKQHHLEPIDYAPASMIIPNVPLRNNITGDEQQVSTVMAPALEQMIAAAKASGVTLNLQSGYRSYAFQLNLYNSYVRSEGQAQADQESARPGYSEHQTGLAADLGGSSNPQCNVEQCFAVTPEGKWLAVHAYEYGFVIRYPDGKQSVTGYEYEPWHVRYVGTELAGEMHKQGVTTLEEFFGIDGGTSYAP